MIIRKEYDIKSLIEQLESDLNVSQQYNTTKVKVNNLVIQDIIDVLKETLKREQKHQTLESAITFIEKEGDTHTNLMEEETVCFGHFDGNDIGCYICDDMKRCEEETNKVFDVIKQRRNKTNE